MGGSQQLARLAGIVAGLGIVIAAAAPFSGVPPQGGSGAKAPASVEVRTVATAAFTIDPLGEALATTALPTDGRTGPLVTVKVRNVTGVPVAISARLLPLAPDLDEAVTVRGSVAGAVVFDGVLGTLGDWSPAVGRLESGQETTLRIRFKLIPSKPEDRWRGRADIRQLELREQPLAAPVDPAGDDAAPAAPAQRPAGSTP